ncbi:MAG TPA: MFS transporter [Hellea balneolensis]|uniref:MFS transporter n=1 Tax=Hellea balneolensis TaxID=287478 RepID=A0A7C3C495_9PROT|nr:MFS transporter [Hellea balneolensis]
MDTAQHKQKIPRQVWMLGFVSLLMDTSSELVHSLLPALFLSLGVSMSAVGLIEGIAEATASIIKVFSGRLSDKLGKRKLLTVIGYGLGALSKPLFPLAGSAGTVFAARFIDRIGKGIRGAPRDALIADVTADTQRGAAYGLRQSLDTIGALLGPSLAVILMIYMANNIQHVLWFAAIPAVLCVIVLIVGVKEPVRKKTETVPVKPAKFRADLKKLPSAYWALVVVGGLFALARFSEAFLALHVLDNGLAIQWSPLVMILMNFVYSLSAFPIGKLADKWPRKPILALGLGFLVLSDLVLGLTTSIGMSAVGIVFWGLHMGLTQGVLSAMIADVAPKHLRGTAFGMFNLVNGIGLLFASLIAGVIWQMVGGPMTFLFGAATALCTLILLGLLQSQRR